MNKINPAVLNNLKSSLMGRLKLSLFKEITGREDMAPAKEKTVRYIESFPPENLTIVEIHTYILADARYTVVEFSELKQTIDVAELFRELNANPLKDPMFYEVHGFYTDQPVGVWINCCELAGDIGYFYAIAFLTDNHYPEELSYYEIRTSQVEPEPAFCYYNEDGDWVSAEKNDPAVLQDPALFLCLQLLSFLSEYHVEHFIPIKKVLGKTKKGKIIQGGPGPEDPAYDVLIKKLYKGEISCHVAYVKPEQVIPFSFDACFMIPFYEIQDNLDLLSEFQRQGIVVYWKDNHFIMSDDYLTYMMLRVAGVNEIKVIILGDEGIGNVKIQASGGSNLLPGVQSFTSPNVDLLNLDLRKLHLDEYITKVAAMNNLQSLLTSKCVVLSEDKNTAMLMTTLVANGFNSDEVTIMSYDNCTKLDLLPLTLETLRKVNKDMLFIIHRDRDYLDESQIEKIGSKITALGAYAFITGGSDVESYFLNTDHIHFLYPALAKEDIERWLEEATAKTRDLSIDKMVKHIYGDKYKEHPEERVRLAKEYDRDPVFFRSGKETMRMLKSLIHPHVAGNVNLIQQSPYLLVQGLQKIGSDLWPY